MYYFVAIQFGCLAYLGPMQTSAVKKLLEWNDGDEDDFTDMHALLLQKCKMAGCGNIIGLYSSQPHS